MYLKDLSQITGRSVKGVKSDHEKNIDGILENSVGVSEPERVFHEESWFKQYRVVITANDHSVVLNAD